METPLGTTTSLPLRVLIVDDEELMRKMTTTAVRAAFPDIVIQTASTVTEAKAEISKECPALLITDMMMGDGSGVDVIAALRETYPAREVPAIVISAFHKEPGLAERLAAMKVVKILEKPFKILALAAICSEILKRESALPSSRANAAPAPNAAPPPIPTNASPHPVPVSPITSQEEESILFNPKKAMELVGFNPKLALEVAALLVRDTPLRLEEMKAALASGEFSVLRKMAHNLKGSAASFAVEGLRAAAFTLEEAARTESAGDAAKAILALHEVYQEIHPILKMFNPYLISRG